MATILVVDDRPTNCEFLKTLLGYGGHLIHVAANGIEALQLARTVAPNLVITDILMPEMDGVELTRKLRADPALAAIPVIFFTATYRVREARKLAASCGVSTVLAKPSEPQAILDAVNVALGTDTLPVPPAIRETAPRAPGVVALRLSAYLQDLSDLQLRMRRIVDQSLALVGDADDLGQGNDGLARSLAEMQAMSLRLTALIELALDLGDKRNAVDLLDLFCRAAQDIMSARYAGIGLLDADGHRLRSWASRGLGDKADAAFASADPLAGLLGKAVATGQPQQLAHNAPHTETGLPDIHPPIGDMVAVAVRSPARSFGWLYLANKPGGEGFGEIDVQVAGTLAAQLAVAYENLVLVEELQHHTGQLEMEMAERARAEMALRDSEERYRQLAENISEVFFVANLDATEMVYVSPAYEDIWGRSCASLYANPRAWMEAVHPDDGERAADTLALIASQGQFDTEFRIIRPDGTIRWIWARGFPVRNASGEVYRMAGVAEDVTERHEQQDSIARLTRGYAVLSGINSAIVRIHERQALLDEVCRRVATETGEFRGAWIGWRDPESTKILPVASKGIAREACSLGHDQDLVDEALRSGSAVYCRDLRTSASGEQCPTAECSCQAVVALPLTQDGLAAGVLVLFASEGVFFDPDERRLLEEIAGDLSFGLQSIIREEKLHYLAYYDALTGLANLTLFQDRLGQLLRLAQRDGTMVATIQLDIARFTYINETLGRHVGDSLLKLIGERLVQAMRDARC